MRPLKRVGTVGGVSGMVAGRGYKDESEGRKWCVSI